MVAALFSAVLRAEHKTRVGTSEYLLFTLISHPPSPSLSNPPPSKFPPNLLSIASATHGPLSQNVPSNQTRAPALFLLLRTTPLVSLQSRPSPFPETLSRLNTEAENIPRNIIMLDDAKLSSNGELRRMDLILRIRKVRTKH